MHERGFMVPIRTRILDDAQTVDPDIPHIERSRNLDGLLEVLG
jgi:hypothetical protein